MRQPSDETIGDMEGALTRMAKFMRSNISARMIALAKKNPSDSQSVQLFKNNGADLSELRNESYQFAFS